MAGWTVCGGGRPNLWFLRESANDIDGYTNMVLVGTWPLRSWIIRILIYGRRPWYTGRVMPYCIYMLYLKVAFLARITFNHNILSSRVAYLIRITFNHRYFHTAGQSSTSFRGGSYKGTHVLETPVYFNSLPPPPPPEIGYPRLYSHQVAMQLRSVHLKGWQRISYFWYFPPFQAHSGIFSTFNPK